MSREEQYGELGRLLVEHGNRRREFSILVGKIKQIAHVFIQNQQMFSNLSHEDYATSLQTVKSQLFPPGTVEHTAGILALIEDYDRVRDHLSRDLEILKEYGVR